MTRPNGGFPSDLLVASKAFLAGCFGCLGVTTATIAILVAALVIFPVPFNALIEAVSVRIVTTVSAVQAAGGVRVLPTECAVAPAETTAIEVFVTKEGVPGAARIVELKLPIHQPPFICVRSTKAVAVQFCVRVVHQNGQVVPFDGQFVTDPSGKVVCLGPLIGLPNTPGVVRIDVLVGSTVVGSTVLTLVDT